MDSTDSLSRYIDRYIDIYIYIFRRAYIHRYCACAALRVNVAGRIGNRFSQAESAVQCQSAVRTFTATAHMRGATRKRSRPVWESIQSSVSKRAGSHKTLFYNWGERERAPSCGLNGRAVTIYIYIYIDI